jgi:Fur family ferric uptake transcriptional regulator
MSDAVELKSSGLKVTFPRLKILDIFRNSGQRHLSAEDVYRLLMADGVEMGLATVYRVLTQFEHADLLSRSQLGGNRAVYELNDGERHHGHLVCTQTGAVKEFYDPQIEKRLQKIANDMGYSLSDYSITLFGEPK